MSQVESNESTGDRDRLRLVVRCGSMRTLHVCTTREKFLHGAQVIVRTPRGMEAGEVLCDATPEALKQLQDPTGGQVMRRLTPQDQAELARIKSKAAEEYDICFEAIRKLDLPMDLIDIEHLFGGERIVVFYLSEGRIDFRELVKSLSGELQTRVEMRQIGIRDEAKLLADYGDCGKPVCCNTHLIKMPPVSMRMAKLQKATLDPNKISGRCGRLKCCLRYEFDTYEELQKELPPIGSQVVTANGKATVLNQEILAQQLLVQTEDNRRIMIAAGDVLAVTRRGSAPRREIEARPTPVPRPAAQSDSNSTEPGTLVVDDEQE